MPYSVSASCTQRQVRQRPGCMPHALKQRQGPGSHTLQLWMGAQAASYASACRGRGDPPGQRCCLRRRTGLRMVRDRGCRCSTLLLWSTAFPVEQQPVSKAVDAACLTCPILSDSPHGCQIGSSLDWLAKCKAHDHGSMPGDSMACHAELTWTFSGVRPVSSSSSHPGCSQSTFSVLPTTSRRRYVVL
jgi:hypothetical protein